MYRVDEDESPFSTADNQVHSQKLKANKVKASKFLEWYMSTGNDYKLLGASIADKLFTDGKASISVVDLFNECGYIPSDICEQKDDKVKQYLPIDLLFEDDITKTNLTDDQKRYYYERGHTSI